MRWVFFTSQWTGEGFPPAFPLFSLRLTVNGANTLSVGLPSSVNPIWKPPEGPGSGVSPADSKAGQAGYDKEALSARPLTPASAVPLSFHRVSSSFLC